MTGATAARDRAPRGAGPARRIAAALLVVTAVLFALGTHAEGGKRPRGEASEEPGEHAAERHGEATTGAEGGATFLGLDLESPLPVTVGVVVSLGLAGALWLSERRGVALAVVAFAVLVAVFDVVEVGHQLDESRAALAALAAAVTAGHIVAAVAAGRTVAGRRAGGHAG